MPSRLFPLIRPAYEQEPGIDLASAEAQNNDALSADLKRQIAFDDQVVNQLRSLKLDDARIEALENSLVDIGISQPLTANPGTPPAVQSTPAVEGDPVVPPPAISLGQPPSIPGTVTPVPLPTGPAPTPADSAGKTSDLPSSTTSGTSTGSPATPISGAAPNPNALPGAAKESASPPTKAPPEGETKDEEEEASRARPVTIFLAVGVCLIAALCVIGYIVWDQMNMFKGTDQIVELLNSTNGLTGDEFEAVQTTTDALKDWFLLKNEHFTVPKEFGATRTIACRVSPFHNANIGEVMAKDDRELLYFLFNPEDLGVQLQQGKWEIVEAERLVGGVTRVESTCFVVAFRGKREDMQAYLARKGAHH
jgi:hypothetical protein